MQVNIKRFEHEQDEGNRGVILVDGQFFGYSIEQSNIHNKPFISRIPAGTYECLRMPTTKHGDRFIVQHVPCRTDIILFHKGNTRKSFAGCIGAGNNLGEMQSERAVWNTAEMCDKFMDIVGNVDKLTLIIEDV